MTDEPTRMAAVCISRQMLRAFLQLPEDAVIQSVHVDPVRDQIVLRVDHSSFAPVKEWEPLVPFTPRYRLGKTEDGKPVPIFESF